MTADEAREIARAARATEADGEHLGQAIHAIREAAGRGERQVAVELPVIAGIDAGAWAAGLCVALKQLGYVTRTVTRKRAVRRVLVRW